MNVETGYMFDFDGSSNLQENLTETHLAIYSRSDDLETAERLSLDMLKQLSKMTNFKIGDTSVILLRAVGKHANYAGADDSGKFYFYTRYRLLLDDKIEN